MSFMAIIIDMEYYYYSDDNRPYTLTSFHYWTSLYVEFDLKK